MTHVVVNASSARVGGALTYLREIMPGLEEHCRVRGAKVTLLASSEAYEALGLGPQMQFVSQPWMHWPGLARMMLEQTYLPLLLRRLRTDALLCVGDNVPLLTGVPCVMLCRNALIYEKGLKTRRMWLLRLLARISLRRADAVVAVSEVLARRVRERFPGSVLHVIYHGSGLDVGSAGQSKPVGAHLMLLCVGSIYRHKRFELAIEALSRLRDAGLNVTLRIIGGFVDPIYHGELKQLANQLNIGDVVDFAGQCGPDGVVRGYREADALLVTSSTESFCHPILEGFRSGVPVLAADDLDVAHEIAGDAAFFFRASPVSLAASFVKILDDPSAREQRVTAGRNRAMNFQWSLAARATGELLLSVAEAR